MSVPTLTRREVATGLGAIIVAFSLHPRLAMTQQPARLPGSLQGNRMLDAWLRTTETGRAEALEALGRRLQGAREHHESAKALDTALFGDDFETA